MRRMYREATVYGPQVRMRKDASSRCGRLTVQYVDIWPDVGTFAKESCTSASKCCVYQLGYLLRAWILESSIDERSGSSAIDGRWKDDVGLDIA